MPKKDPMVDPTDKRKYIRLKSVFPVDFSIVRLQGDLPGLDWKQGYTCNVSKGGLCLESVEIRESTLNFLNQENIFLDLRIHIPLGQKPVKAVAEVAWFKKEEHHESSRFILGLKFHSITQVDLKRVIGQATWIKYSSRAAIILSIVLSLALVASGFYNFKLRLVNERLINQFVEIQQEEIKVSDTLSAIAQKKKDVSKKMNSIIEKLSSSKSLENEYEQLIERENRISDRLKMIESKKGGLQKTVLETMHLWLQNRQDPSTGLILSFEGNVDVIKHWAFIYDQALAVNVFLSFDNVEGAKIILDFFNEKLSEGFAGFYNAYYYDSGKVSEYTIHSGPNIWIGIAALQFMHKTEENTYLPLAQKIADWLIGIQSQDPAGGIKGGPAFSWFATEHNLDAYAFFGMLADLTKDEKYNNAQAKILSWLKKYAMIPHGKDYKSPPINRGRGDSTIATDTFSWSLAALGPEKLVDIGMNPEKIMNFAEEHCGVEVQYKRPSGVVVEASGFDFAKHAHMPRGGLISPEWTSQMIISYRMLSDYFSKSNNVVKEGFYREKAEEYLNELNKLIISSPSPKGQGEGCLPYATLENADTGHGWNTPYGASTCSIAGTAYMILAIKQVNPLELQ